MSRLALVIGNEKYLCHSELSNPSNDASEMASLLSYKGFKVILKTNVSSSDFNEAIQELAKNSDDADVILFFFAGHGIQEDGVNYLLPTDDDSAYPRKYSSISVDYLQDVFSKLPQKCAKIIIIDACRVDPDKQWTTSALNSRSIKSSVDKNRSRGFSATTSHTNTIIAFSTAPGTTASDGNSKNKHGVYTEALLECITAYGLSIETMLKKVRELVIEKTNFAQIPWEHSSLTTPFSFDQLTIPDQVSDKLHIPFDNVRSMAVADDYLYVVGDKNKIFQAKLTHGQAYIPTGAPEESSFEAIVIGPYNSPIAASGKDIYMLGENGFEKKTSQNFEIFCLAISKDKKYLAVAGMGNKIGIFDTATWKNEKDLAIRGKGDTYSITFCPDNSDLIAYGCTNHKFVVNNWKTNKEVFCALRKFSTYTYGVQYSKNSKYFVTSHDSGVIEIRNGKDYSLIRQVNLPSEIENAVSLIELGRDGLPRLSNNVLAISIDPTESYLVAGTNDGKILFIDLRYGSIIKELNIGGIESYDISSLTLSDDGKYLFTSGKPMSIYMLATIEAD